MYPKLCSVVLPMSLLPPVCSTQKPSVHQGTGVRFQSRFSNLFLQVSISIFSVFILMDLLKNSRDILLKASQSVNFSYRSLNFGLNSGISIQRRVVVYFK